jgi:outer membrane protein assembly factor BamA
MFTSDTGELYTPDYYLVKAVFEHRVWKKIFAGPQMKIKYHYLVDIEEQGLLASDSPRGMEAGLSSGFGFSMRFDNRDNHYSTTSGQFLQIAWLHYSSAWLSNYQFNEWRFDARQFLKVGARSVLGFQLLHRIHDGYAPFHQLASLGGQSMLRGYYEGRFRDKYALAVQTEYRMPVWGDLGFAVFAASGTVASDWVEMFRSVWKPAGGVGFRYRVMRWREGVLRFDVAVNAEGKVVWYAFFSEAF